MPDYLWSDAKDANEASLLASNNALCDSDQERISELIDKILDVDFQEDAEMEALDILNEYLNDTNMGKALLPKQENKLEELEKRYEVGKNKNKNKQQSFGTQSTSNLGFTGTNFHSSSVCHHYGDEVVMRITHKDGTETTIGGAKAHDAEHTQFLAKLVIDCSGAFRAGSKTFVESKSESELSLAIQALNKYAQPPEVVRFNWEDHGIPPVGYQFWVDLMRLLPEGHVIICCIGSHGRTGTAMASLLVAGNPSVTAKKAIEEIRAIHCDRCIETTGQEDYIAGLVEERDRIIEAKKAQKKASCPPSKVAMESAA